MTRNDVLGFAEYTWINLEALRTAHAAGARVHLTTQLTNSLLGIVVFLDTEKPILETIKRDTLPEPSALQVLCDGKPSKIETLGFLVSHLRNAVAHRDLQF